jgi:hypothetical protein
MDNCDKNDIEINDISKKVKQIKISENYDNIKWLTGC